MKRRRGSVNHRRRYGAAVTTVEIDIGIVRRSATGRREFARIWK